MEHLYLAHVNSDKNYYLFFVDMLKNITYCWNFKKAFLFLYSLNRPKPLLNNREIIFVRENEDGHMIW